MLTGTYFNWDDHRDLPHEVNCSPDWLWIIIPVMTSTCTRGFSAWTRHRNFWSLREVIATWLQSCRRGCAAWWEALHLPNSELNPEPQSTSVNGEFLNGPAWRGRTRVNDIRGDCCCFPPQRLFFFLSLSCGLHHQTFVALFSVSLFVCKLELPQCLWHLLVTMLSNLTTLEKKKNAYSAQSL